MSDIHAGDTAFTSSPTYPRNVRHVGADQPAAWLAAGWRDFLAAPAISLSIGLLFVIAGLALTVGLWRMGQFYMIVPLTSGFFILGPALTLGFQAVSRDLEKHEQPSLTRALGSWRDNVGPIFSAGLAFMFLFLVWIRLAQLAFALAFPATAGLNASSMLTTAFTTTGGLEFVALFMALGFVAAALAFAGGAFALPMLLDRKVGMFEAISTSIAAVTSNLGVMAIWAVMLVVLVALGFALFFVGLAVTLPVAGYATWHAYRAVIAR